MNFPALTQSTIATAPPADSSAAAQGTIVTTPPVDSPASTQGTITTTPPADSSASTQVTIITAPPLNSQAPTQGANTTAPTLKPPSPTQGTITTATPALTTGIIANTVPVHAQHQTPASYDSMDNQGECVGYDSNLETSKEDDVMTRDFADESAP